MSRNVRRGTEPNNERFENAVLERLFLMSDAQGPEPAVISSLAEPGKEHLGKHVERTQIFCHLLAMELRRDTDYESKINDGYIKDIYYAAALHDVGKNGIPEQILFKEGKLSSYEYEMVKTHTEIGRRILVKIFSRYSHNEFARLSIEIAGSHHEKWDGSGYPEGLYGLDIPLSARIMALVDVYDSLRSRMPYKEAVSHQETVRIIMEGGGVHFDPSVVKAFSNIESKFDYLYETFQ